MRSGRPTGRWLLLFLFLLLPSSAVQGGVWESLSEGAHWLWGGRCEAPRGESQEQAALAELRGLCDQDSRAGQPLDGPNQSNLRTVLDAVSASPDREQAYFGLLAHQSAQELECSEKTAREFATDGSEALRSLTEDIKHKIPALQRLNREVFRLEHERRLAARQVDRARAGIGPDSVEQVRARSVELEKKLRESESSRRAILASIPFSDFPAVQSQVRALVGASPGQDAVGDRTLDVGSVLRSWPPVGESVANTQDLSRRIQRAMQSLTRDLAASRSRMQAVARAQGAGATSEEKYHLARDPLLVERLLSRSPQAAEALRPLACRMDARFGTGSDYLDLTLFAGSAVGSVGAGAALKLAQGATRGVAAIGAAARGRGLISLNSARVLQGAAYGLDSVAAVRGIGRACLGEGGPAVASTREPGGAGANVCSAASAVQVLTQDNCVLNAALGALSFGAASAFTFSEVQEFARYIGLSRRQTPRPVQGELTPAGPVARSETEQLELPLGPGRAGPASGERPAGQAQSPSGPAAAEPAGPGQGSLDLAPVRGPSSRPVLGWGQIAPQVTAPLPRDFVARLRESPRVAELSREYQRGRGLTIELTPYHARLEETGTYVKPSDGIGESNQAVFVARVLREILPEARIVGQGEAGTGRSVVQLSILDTAETGDLIRTLRNPGQLEMADLKLANPVGEPLNRQQVRQALGLSAETRVVSLNNGLYSSDEQIVGLVRGVLSSPARPNVVMISRSFQAADARPMHQWANELQRAVPDARVLLMSEMRPGLIPPGSESRYIIVNDTRGFMHAQYAAADVNVTAGAVNLAEPVIQGTPTLYFGPRSEFRAGYNEAVFDRMAALIDQTGGARRITMPSDVGPAVAQAFRDPPRAQIAPHQAREAGGQETALDRMVRAVDEALTSSIDRSELRAQFPRTAARAETAVGSELSRIAEYQKHWDTVRGLEAGHSAGVSPPMTRSIDRSAFRALSPGHQARLSQSIEGLRSTLSQVARTNGSIHQREAVANLFDLDRLVRTRIRGDSLEVLPDTVTFLRSIQRDPRASLSARQLIELHLGPIDGRSLLPDRRPTRIRRPPQLEGP